MVVILTWALIIYSLVFTIGYHIAKLIDLFKK